jgi:hypothetical protein
MYAKTLKQRQKDLFIILKNLGPLVQNGREWEVKSKHMKVVLQKGKNLPLNHK